MGVWYVNAIVVLVSAREERASAMMGISESRRRMRGAVDFYVRIMRRWGGRSWVFVSSATIAGYVCARVCERVRCKGAERGAGLLSGGREGGAAVCVCEGASQSIDRGIHVYVCVHRKRGGGRGCL